MAWLAAKGTSAGVDLTKGEGVPLAYDYVGGPVQETFFDLTDSSRDVTPIFAQLRSQGWPGGVELEQSLRWFVW